MIFYHEPHRVRRTTAASSFFLDTTEFPLPLGFLFRKAPLTDEDRANGLDRISEPPRPGSTVSAAGLAD
jgi:hypothetical protein